MEIDFTPFENEQLKEDYKKLISINEKIDFWNNKLNFPFYNYFILDDSRKKDFLLEPESDEERIILNKRIIEEYPTNDLIQKLDISNAQSSFEKFTSELENIVNKINFITTEIRKIDSLIFEKERHFVDPKYGYSYQSESNLLFIKGFKEYYFQGNEPEFFKDEHIAPMFLIAINDGYETGKYKKLLEELREEETNPKKKKKEQITLNHQLLILHYLGVLKTINPHNSISQVKQAELLSTLLNADAQNIRKVLTNFKEDQLRSSKAKEYLVSIYELFEKTGLKDFAQEVKDDIDSLNKKKL